MDRATTSAAAMRTTQFIAQHGFRRWYERELIRGHAHLVMLLLCAVAVMGAVEAFGQQHGLQRLVPVLCLLVAAAVGAWAVRRYLFHLGFAEAMAHQAECPHCRTYARWQADGPATDEPGHLQMPVRCRACQGRWTIRW
jgi:hypothetical protein